MGRYKRRAGSRESEALVRVKRGDDRVLAAQGAVLAGRLSRGQAVLGGAGHPERGGVAVGRRRPGLRIAFDGVLAAGVALDTVRHGRHQVGFNVGELWISMMLVEGSDDMIQVFVVNPQFS